MADGQQQNLGLEDPSLFEASLTTDETVIEPQVAAPAEGHTPPPVDARIMDAMLDLAGPAPGWAGKRLGRFRLLRLLGQGAMGIVVLAEDVNLRRLVALKILRRQIRGLDQAQQVNQFLREARAAARIEHPNVVHIHEINQVDGWWYIAMEYLEGGSLSHIVKAGGPLPPARACPLLADAASALAAAHEAGIIHRDVKPANLMLTRTGRGKLTDFGLVRLNDPDDPFDFTPRAVGSPSYMAPEILQRQGASPASDVYALGATLFFALTGRPPYEAQSLKELADLHRHAPLPELAPLAPTCGPSLARLVSVSLAKDPAVRPPAEQLAAALRGEAIGSNPDDSHPTGLSTSAVQQPLAGARRAPSARLARTWTTVGLSITAAALALALLWMLIGPWLTSLHSPRSQAPAPLPPGHAQRTFERLFANAPAAYGTRPAGAPVHFAMAPQDSPPFGWKERVDAGQAAFVASRSGLFYFRIDDPRALLIPARQLVTYPSADAARAAGRQPAPPPPG